MARAVQASGHMKRNAKRSVQARLPEDVYVMLIELVDSYGGNSAMSAVIGKAIRCLHAADPEIQRHRELQARDVAPTAPSPSPEKRRLPPPMPPVPSRRPMLPR
jgi:Arc/MetJ-type ribon-helix-helix transcriptional regulator